MGFALGLRIQAMRYLISLWHYYYHFSWDHCIEDLLKKILYLLRIHMKIIWCWEDTTGGKDG